MQIIGQKENLEIIDSWKKLPNFIIIQGEKHTGKTCLLLYLCEKFDLHYINVGNSVSTVRTLVSKMVPNSNTIYHFKDFDTASLQAKNALLKVTEECIEGNYIAITGGPQIKTLESRARRILMSPYTFDEVRGLFKQEESVAYELFNCGINTPAKIKYYKDYEDLESTMNLAKGAFNLLTYITPASIISLIGNFENRYDEIDRCMLFLDMLIFIIEQDLKQKQFYNYFVPLEIILKGKKDLIREPTLRRKMLLYNILYDIKTNNEESVSYI